jgi:hypothetical protein
MDEPGKSSCPQITQTSLAKLWSAPMQDYYFFIPEHAQ